GWITYMRTDSMNLSQLCLNSCGPVIKSLMGEEYHHRHTYHTQAKGAQEAHEAIRPTDMSREKIDGTPQEKRLYSLIWKRTIASQMADAKLEKTVITITVGGREEVFQASGEVLLFDGFLKVYRESRDVENENENDEALLPPLSEGDVLGYADISARQRYSRQPMRYTEASLVHKMEELGIGRPSTYAPTISTIQQRKYVEKGDREGFLRTCDVLTLAQGEISASQVEERVGAEKGKLLPTDTGTVVNDFLTDNFPEILDYNFTANVEKDFDNVAEGKKEWTSLIQQFYGDFSPNVDRAMEERTELRVGEREIGIDPESGKPVKVRIGKFGPMVQIGVAGEDDKPRFATLPANLSMNTITLEEALELFRLPRKLGEYEGELIEVNTGRFGPYVRHAGKFVSIPKGEDPLDISLERAVELIQEKRDSEEKSHLKSFDEEPEMEVRTGRYGPYIVYKGKNYRIPKNKAANAADLTLEECRKIVETPVKAKKK
ncbi:MAG: DNA topoisomerase I, partial [Bacteroidaceae bacterium]|nr:DNA topoisomerase I [Bacteroidaceae bacterium]